MPAPADEHLPQLARQVPALRAALEAQRAQARAERELLRAQGALLEASSTRTHELLGHVGPWRACTAASCAEAREAVDAARGPVTW